MRQLLVLVSLILAGFYSFGQTLSGSAQPKPPASATGAASYTRFLWRGMKTDQEDGKKYSSIIINEKYCKTLTEQQRAALGYVVTFIGSECEWDGRANEQMSNLKCLTLTALDLGYQCSEKHLGFLKKWFRNDTAALKTLAHCPVVPFTASHQNTFDEIKISTAKNTIKVWFSASAVAMSDHPETWEWTETQTFAFTGNSIWLVSTKRSKVKHTRE